MSRYSFFSDLTQREEKKWSVYSHLITQVSVKTGIKCNHLADLCCSYKAHGMLGR